MDQVAPNDNANTTASEGNREVNTAADLARLRNEGKTLTPQELKELSARIKALKEIAKMEDRLKALESQKRPRSYESLDQTLILEGPTASNRPEATEAPNVPLPSIGRSSHCQGCSQVDTDDSDNLDSSSSSTAIRHCHKRRRFTKGIKITLGYTLRVSLSLREWGDWKKDIERVFEGDPSTYRTSAQKILKALDYLDSNLKSL